MCLHCNEGKLLSALMLQSDHKSPLIKSQIARCFEQLIRQLGQRIITESPKMQARTIGGGSGSPDNWDRITLLLSTFINDSAQEVRSNARNALLSMEHGLNPVGTRADIEKYVRKVIPKEFDQNKVLQIFQEGMQRQKSLEASLHSFASMAKSTLR